MILTCPECATRYSVPDGSVGAEGRTVRCAQCGLTWRADGGATLELASAPMPAHDFDLKPAMTGDELPRAFRERLAAQHSGREAARSSVLLGVGAAMAALLLIGLVLGRVAVVKSWPKTASVYAALGLPVNSVGLTLEVKTEPLGFYNGRPAAIVTGTLENIRSWPVEVPPLRITLLGADQKVLDTRIYRIPNVEIEPGAKRTFAVRMVDPPEPTRDMDVTFVLGEPRDRDEAGSEQGGAAVLKAAELRPAHGGDAH